MDYPTLRPFEAFASSEEQVLLLEHDIFLPYCFEVSDSTDNPEEVSAEV